LFSKFVDTYSMSDQTRCGLTLGSLEKTDGTYYCQLEFQDDQEYHLHVSRLFIGYVKAILESYG